MTESSHPVVSGTMNVGPTGVKMSNSKTNRTGRATAVDKNCKYCGNKVNVVLAVPGFKGKAYMKRKCCEVFKQETK